MAGAALGMVGGFAGGAVQKVEDFASQQAAAFAESPLDYLIKVLWEWGLIFLAAGILMSLLGFVLRTHGTRASNDEAAFLAQEAAIFNNLAAPSLPAMSWNIGADVGIALNDAATVAAWVPQEVFNGVSDIGKAIWLGLKNVPRLLWDDLQIVAGITVGGGLDLIFPFFVLGGLIMASSSLILQFVRSEILPRVRIAGRARWEAWVSEPLDSLFGTAKDLPAAVREAREAVTIEAAGAEDPAPAAALPVAAPPPPAESHIEADVVTTDQGNTGLAGDEAEGATTATTDEPTPPPPPEAPIAAPTVEVEDELGVSYTQAKDRMRAALWKRDHPDPAPEPEPTFEEAIQEQGEAEQQTAEDEMRRALEYRDEMATA